MTKAGCLVAILLSSCLTGFAQGAKKNYPKFEFFVGYSRETTSNDTCAIVVAIGTPYCAVRIIDYVRSDADYYKHRIGLNGIEASVVRNFNKYFGLKGDFSAHFKKELVTAEYPQGTVQFLAQARLLQYMAGPELKIRNRSSFTPFAFGLIGRAHTATKTTGRTIPNGPVFAGVRSGDAKLASAVGGGLDVQVSERASLRSSIDYNPIRARMVFMRGSGQTQNNIRTSIGVLFR